MPSIKNVGPLSNMHLSNFFNRDPHCGSGSRIFPNCGSGASSDSRVLVTKSLGLRTVAQATGETFSPQKRTSSTSKHENSLLFSIFVVIFALLDPDPYPATQSNANPCGSVSGYASCFFTIHCVLVSRVSKTNFIQRLQLY
jgi:hypothetical protein